MARTSEPEPRHVSIARTHIRFPDSDPGPQERLAAIDTQRPVSPSLVDSFNRRHDYLRISLTERCNLRCVSERSRCSGYISLMQLVKRPGFYCMPGDGIELSPREHILTDDEVIRLATLFVKSGVTKIRLTGGEPTVRKGLVDVVGTCPAQMFREIAWLFTSWAARLNELRGHGLKSIGMTSNGIALERRLPTLVENGLTHLNLRYF